jgi:hypothetical protein
MTGQTCPHDLARRCGIKVDRAGRKKRRRRRRTRKMKRARGRRIILLRLLMLFSCSLISSPLSS